MKLFRCAIPLLSFGVLFLFSCNKTVIVVPDACLSADKSSAHIGDSIIFSNCSTAEITQLMFFKGKVMPDEQPYFQFDNNGKFKQAFTDTGSWTAMVRAINTNAPIKDQKIMLKIID